MRPLRLLRGMFGGIKHTQPARKYPQLLTIQEIKNAKASDKPWKLYDRDELPTFLHALKACQGEAATRLGLWLLILTLARTGEVRETNWAEFKREEGLWTVPRERMKNRREHRVSLSQQALATLEELHKISGHWQ